MLYFPLTSRNRTPSEYIGYGLYLYLLDGLSFRNSAKALSFLQIVKRSHVSIWMEMDSKVQTRKNILKEKECFKIHY